MSTLLKGFSACYLYKRQPVYISNQSIRFQTLLNGQDQRAVQGCQGRDCIHTQGSDWGCMQDLTSWSFNDHENGEETAQNYMGGSCQ